MTSKTVGVIINTALSCGKWLTTERSVEFRWDVLAGLFGNSMNICDSFCATECDETSHTGLQVCADIWAGVKPPLPEHVQDFAQNIELLRKSQEDVGVDRAERSAVAPTMMDALFSDLEDDSDDHEAEVSAACPGREIFFIP
jgi:hypothetical protein